MERKIIKRFVIKNGKRIVPNLIIDVHLNNRLDVEQDVASEKNY